MDFKTLVILSFAALTSAWSIPFYPVARHPLRVTRHAHHAHQHQHRIPPPVREAEQQWQRPKRDHDDYDHDDHELGHGHSHGHNRGTSGVTGPVHTFVKTDKNANYKWGVRHHVGNKYAS